MLSAEPFSLLEPRGRGRRIFLRSVSAFVSKIEISSLEIQILRRCYGDCLCRNMATSR